MKTNATSRLKELTSVLNRFDSKSIVDKQRILTAFGKENLSSFKYLLEYHHCLMFLLAYPADEDQRKMCEQELLRMASLMKKMGKAVSKWENTGLPFTDVVSNFSHKLVKWLLSEEFHVSLEGYEKKGDNLLPLLKCTLPDLERDLVDLSNTNQELMDLLGLKQDQILEFLVSEFQRLEASGPIRDHLFDSLALTFRISLGDEQLGFPFNRLPVDSVFYHASLLRDFDRIALLKEPLPDPEFLSFDLKAAIPRVSKLKLLYLQRETEPVSYMDPESLRYFSLDRGISVAIFTMVPERQLPLESYVGYTLFKNGLPAAYGGAWVFGQRALFGINVFEWFRGGESAYMLWQLLRVYHQLFNVEYFEVEPYQFGLNNEEGIDSGAFWFYFRNGFIPEDPALAKLASSEFAKIQKSKTYKSSKATLTKLTGSNVVLQLGKKVPIALWEIRERVTAYINKHFQGNRYRAERASIQSFLQKTGFRKPTEPEFRKVLADVALIYESMQWTSTEQVFHMKEMILKKPKDLYRYQDELLKLLALVSSK